MSAHDSSDDRIRDAFSDLASSERASAPSFDAVLTRPVVRERSLGALVAVRLAAAGVLVAVGITTYHVARPRETRLVVPNEVVALMAWQPSTDVLLRPRAWDVTQTTVDLRSSILDSPTASDTSSGEDR
jgi:hypothetical protein